MRKEKYNPTDSELEILQILWDMGEARVKEVHEQLNSSKNVGYTTVLKIMQIMHDKDILERRIDGKSHIYKARLDREEVEENVMDKVMRSLYKGSRFNLVMSALGNYNASEKELMQIKDLINKMEKKEE